MYQDLLFEIGVEELPSALVQPLSMELKNAVIAALQQENISHGKVRVFATPRRIALYIAQVATLQAPKTISRRGPVKSSITDPNKALLGFASSCGVSIHDLCTISTDQGEWWGYEAVLPGVTTDALLPKILDEITLKLPIPKPMRWGATNIAFARPVHWVVLMLGQEVIAATILGVATNNITYGHRFHHPAPIILNHAAEYEAALKAAYVIADFSTRRATILQQIEQLTSKNKLKAVLDPVLVDEVTSIVEWPNAMLATFDEDFLNIPAEALIAAMQVHQKCFALQDTQQKLSASFITIANVTSLHPEQVVIGNESVMRARLSDAAFFYEQDKKHTLASLATNLSRVVFQSKLGTLADKTMRIQTILLKIAKDLPEKAMRTALLSKCDLLTGMVGEFPELQGIMGMYYAQNDAEDSAVCTAIREQYLPRFASDDLPKSQLGMALSLADRIDTLLGIFSIGQAPKGTKDPFKLRRHALAIARICMQTPIALTTLIQYAVDAYNEQLPNAQNYAITVKHFILERLPAFYQQQSIPADWVDAVCAVNNDCLYIINQRLIALSEFMRLPSFAALSAINKRVNQILGAHEYNQIIDATLLVAKEEQNLYDKICGIPHTLKLEHKAEILDYLSRLTTLAEPINEFFAKVLVMVDDDKLKNNRLQLLAKLQSLLRQVADLTFIAISK